MAPKRYEGKDPITGQFLPGHNQVAIRDKDKEKLRRLFISCFTAEDNLHFADVVRKWIDSDNPAASIAALTFWRDTCYGKPRQALDITSAHHDLTEIRFSPEKAAEIRTYLEARILTPTTPIDATPSTQAESVRLLAHEGTEAKQGDSLKSVK